MEIRTSRLNGNISVVELSGDVDLYCAPDAKQEIGRIFVSSSAVVLDLTRVDYMDSSGIGVLLFGFTESRKLKKGFCIAGVSGQVRRVIELTSLLGFLPITNSPAEAVERLRS